MKLPPLKVKDPSPAHVAFRDDMIATLRKHQHLRADELLAVASYFVGQLIALQDQRMMTPAMAMQIVGANIEAGNQQAQSEIASVSTSVSN